MLAACCHLSIGDVQRALHRLLHGNEVELAYALAEALCVRTGLTEDVYRAMSVRCERFGAWDEALECLKKLSDPQVEIILLAARYINLCFFGGGELIFPILVLLLCDISHTQHSLFGMLSLSLSSVYIVGLCSALGT